MKLFLFGDNRPTRNIGARATSIALKNLLDNGFQSLPSLHSPWMENAGTDTAQNKALLAAQHPDHYQTLCERIRESDIVAINGEGMFLFSGPMRTDLACLLIVMHLCLEHHKPFFVVNAGFSPPTDPAGNGQRFAEPDQAVLEESLRYLRKAALVAARDALSVAFLEKYDDSLNVQYIPDALFSLYDFYGQNGPLFDTMLKTPQYVLCHNREESPIPKYNFEKDYVLMAGSAFAARYGAETRAERFGELALALRDMLREHNTELYLLEACDGDSVLRLDVNQRTGIPYIPVTTNIFLLGRILGRCRCLVSGRFHPSIFAAMGGASLVLMGSDSHKIAALPDMLNLPGGERAIHPALPDSRQIADIVAATQRVVTALPNRDARRRASEANGEKAKTLPDLIRERL